MPAALLSLSTTSKYDAPFLQDSRRSELLLNEAVNRAISNVAKTTYSGYDVRSSLAPGIEHNFSSRTRHVILCS